MGGKAVVVHDIEHARIALAAAKELGKPVTLLSAPAAASAVGPAWFAALVSQAQAEFPDVAVDSIFDCDRAAGRAMAALQTGFNGLVFTGTTATLLKLADLGEDRRCTLYDQRPAALDLLGQKNPAAAVRAWLAS